MSCSQTTQRWIYTLVFVMAAVITDLFSPVKGCRAVTKVSAEEGTDTLYIQVQSQPSALGASGCRRAGIIIHPHSYFYSSQPTTASHSQTAPSNFPSNSYQNMQTKGQFKSVHFSSSWEDLNEMSEFVSLFLFSLHRLLGDCPGEP